MKLRTQLLAAAVIAVGMGLAACFSIWRATQQEDIAEQQQQQAQAVARELSGLLALTHDFARERDPQSEQQWRQRQGAVSLALATQDNRAPHSSETDGLREGATRLGLLFDRLADLPPADDSPLVARRRELLVDQLLTDTQHMADAAYRWAREASLLRGEAERRHKRMTLLAVTLLMLMIVGQAAIGFRRVLAPLHRLGVATAALERGELGERIGSTSTDELGSVSRRFDAMAQALSQRTEQLEAAERRFRAIAENVPAGVVHIDGQQRLQFANAEFCRSMGLPIERLLGLSIREIQGEQDYLVIRNPIEAALRGETVSFESAPTRFGRPRYFYNQLVPDLGADGRVAGAYALVQDITERKLAEIEQAAAKRRLRDITDNLPALISYIDHEERLQFANDTFKSWMGFDPALFIGKPLIEIIGPALYAQRKPFLDRALRGERVCFELESSALDVQRHLKNEYIPDVQKDGRVAGIYALSSDITAMKLVEQHLAQLARIDTLTGLPNRREFGERLPTAMSRARRSRRLLALLFLDVDRFKQINDTFGHAVGDEVLKIFGHRLLTCVRETDTVARLAGDEFTVILEGLNTQAEPKIVAAKIIEAMSRPFDVDDRTLAVSTSIGIAVYDGNAETAEALTARADGALYEAKRAGRNTYRDAGALVA